MAYISKNPFTGVVNAKFDSITDHELKLKLVTAQKAQEDWKVYCFEGRAKLLLNLSELLKKDTQKYAELISIEMGKPITQALGEVRKCAWLCEYFAEKGSAFLQGHKLDSTSDISQVCYDPLGVIFAIMPWNFPFWQVFRCIVPAIMAGNVVVLKHASNVPQCAEAIEGVFLEAGFNVGVLQNLFINYSQVEQTIANPIIKAVAFTGSNKIGSIVAQIAGKYIKKSVLELGGSDPFIVFEDADLNLALEYVVLSRFLNAGQSCIAAKRLILHEDIVEEFVHNLKALIENFAIGDPIKQSTFMGPMVNEKAIQMLERQLEESTKLGAECIIGGHRYKENEGVFMPSLYSNVPINSPLWNEEIFGPVATVHIFSSDDEALELANNTRFGLGASVWTTDTDRASLFAEKLEAGTVAINNMVKSEPGLPFGGIKDSGYGRELGKYGMHEFMNIKAVTYS